MKAQDYNFLKAIPDSVGKFPGNPDPGISGFEKCRVSICGYFPPKWRFASAGWREEIVATSHSKCGYFGIRKMAILAILHKLGLVTSLLLNKCSVSMFWDHIFGPP